MVLPSFPFLPFVSYLVFWQRFAHAVTSLVMRCVRFVNYWGGVFADVFQTFSQFLHNHLNGSTLLLLLLLSVANGVQASGSFFQSSTMAPIKTRITNGTTFTGFHFIFTWHHIPEQCFVTDALNNYGSFSITTLTTIASLFEDDAKRDILVNDALTAVRDAYIEQFFKTNFSYSTRNVSTAKDIIRDCPMHVVFKSDQKYKLENDNNLATAINKRGDCFPKFDIYGEELVLSLTMRRCAPYDSNSDGRDLTALMVDAPAKTTVAYKDYVNAVAGK